MNFCILSHNEPEIFRLLDSLVGERIYVIDDFSDEYHARAIKQHRSLPTVVTRKLGKNFAAQRNFAHNLIPEGEWVCWLDADEEIIPSVFLPVMKARATSYVDAVLVNRLNIVTDGEWIAFQSFEAHIRAYRVAPGVRWEGNLHEVVVGCNNPHTPKRGELMIAHAKTVGKWDRQTAFYSTFKDRLNVVIGMTCYARPDCLRRSLERLKEVNNKGWPLYIRIDPGHPKQGEVESVIRELHPEATVRTNVQRLHNRWSIKELLDQMTEFEMDAMVLLEDDLILAPDALDLCQWHLEQPNYRDYMALCLFNHSRGKEDGNEICESRHFSPLGWVITRERWLEIRDRWMCDLTGWDYSMNKILRDMSLKTLCPSLSRTTHIGKEGEHMRPEEHDKLFARHAASDGSQRDYRVNLKVKEGHLPVT